MAKKTKEPITSIFDVLDEPEETKTDETSKPEVDVTALMAKIASLEGTIQGMQYNPAAAAATYTPPAPQPNVAKDWGDPVSEPEKFSQNLVQSITSIFEARDAQQRRQQEAQNAEKNRADALWNDYSTVHPEYKDQPDRVGYAARIVAERAEKKGYDLNKYLANRAQFFEDVTQEMVKVFGEGKKSDEPSEEPSRTAGIFGGMESGGKPAKGSAPKPGDLIEDLKAVQRAMGIF